MQDIMNVNPGLIFWSLINFSILLFILSKFAFPAMKKSLQSREEGIKNAIDEANALNEKAQKLLAESQEKLDNAQKEVSQILTSAKNLAEQNIQKANEEAEKNKNHKIEEAKREIERSKNDAISELRNEVADLVVTATEKILEVKLDKESHLKLAKEQIEKLPKN
ncbi:MAG: F0F1 ATP synthase subunit B [Candidatus Kapaibacterium sp.]